MLGIAIIAITGMQLMATLDGTIVIVALPRMQAELDLSDAAKSWVITAYVLTFGACCCSVAALVTRSATSGRSFPGSGLHDRLDGLRSGHRRAAVDRRPCGSGRRCRRRRPDRPGADRDHLCGRPRTQPGDGDVGGRRQGMGSVLGLVLGGALTVISWRLAFLINFPIGILIIWIALTRLEETRHERLKLDVTGALLATLGCGAAVMVFTRAHHAAGTTRGHRGRRRRGPAGHHLLHRGAVRRSSAGAAVVVPQSQPGGDVHPLFLAGGVMLSLTVMIGPGVQDVLGYSALHAGIGFIPFAVALGLGNLVTARLAPYVAPRWLIIGGGALVLGAMLFGSTLTRTIPYFPDLVLPILVGFRNRGDLGDPAAVRGRGRWAPRDRAGQRRHPDGSRPRRAAGSGRHPGRPDLPNLVPGRHHRPGGQHEPGATRRPRRRVHLFFALDRRRCGAGRCGRAVHPLRPATSPQLSTPEKRSRQGKL